MKKWEKPTLQHLELKLTNNDDLEQASIFELVRCCKCRAEYFVTEAIVLGFKCNKGKKGQKCGGTLIAKFKQCPVS